MLADPPNLRFYRVSSAAGEDVIDNAVISQGDIIHILGARRPLNINRQGDVTYDPGLYIAANRATFANGIELIRVDRAPDVILPTTYVWNVRTDADGITWRVGDFVSNRTGADIIQYGQLWPTGGFYIVRAIRPGNTVMNIERIL